MSALGTLHAVEREANVARAGADVQLGRSLWLPPALLLDIPDAEIVASQGEADRLGLACLEGDAVELTQHLGRLAGRLGEAEVDLRVRRREEARHVSL